MGKNVVQSLHERYMAPTPMVWVAIGDAFLTLGTTMTVTFAGQDMPKGWIMASAIITAAGKIIPGFVKQVSQKPVGP